MMRSSVRITGEYDSRTRTRSLCEVGRTTGSASFASMPHGFPRWIAYLFLLRVRVYFLIASQHPQPLRKCHETAPLFLFVGRWVGPVPGCGHERVGRDRHGCPVFHAKGGRRSEE